MPRSLPESVLGARRALAAATSEYLAIPDAALERPWQFRGVEQDVRYGLYRAAESVEGASAEIAAILAGAPPAGAPLAGAPLAGAPARSGAAERIAAATIERWELHGLLATLSDDVLDRVPKPGEWTAREALAHIVDTQRGYGWTTRWWVSRPPDAERLPRLPAEAPRATRRCPARPPTAPERWGTSAPASMTPSTPGARSWRRSTMPCSRVMRCGR